MLFATFQPHNEPKVVYLLAGALTSQYFMLGGKHLVGRTSREYDMAEGLVGDTG